ncbi:MAG: histidine phosphatase family protein [Verrucomicrobiia bacterium]|jgi:broad specificity phosphatase PhoE
MGNHTQLVLMRHGEVDTRYHRIFGGKIDMDLSPNGREQAERLAEYLKPTTFDSFFVSSMKRARQTSEPLVASGKPEPRVLQGLREIDFGEWTGKTWMQVQEEHQVNVFTWLDELEAGRVKDAESGTDFRQRLRESLDEILQHHEGKTIGIMCHGGVVRGLLALLLDMPIGLLGRIDIEYASLSRVEVHPHKCEAKLINLAPWRDCATG